MLLLKYGTPPSCLSTLTVQCLPCSCPVRVLFSLVLVFPILPHYCYLRPINCCHTFPFYRCWSLGDWWSSLLYTKINVVTNSETYSLSISTFQLQIKPEKISDLVCVKGQHHLLRYDRNTGRISGATTDNKGEGISKSSAGFTVALYSALN